MKKQFFQLLVMSLLALSLTACGGGASDTDGADSEGGDSNEVASDDSRTDIQRLFDGYENLSTSSLKVDEKFTIKRVEENDFFNAKYVSTEAEPTFTSFGIKIGRCDEGGSNCDYLKTEESYLDIYKKEDRSVGSGTLDIDGTPVYYSIEQQESDGEKSTYMLLGWRQGNFFLNGEFKEYWEMKGDTFAVPELESMMEKMMKEVLDATGDGL